MSLPVLTEQDVIKKINEHKKIQNYMNKICKCMQKLGHEIVMSSFKKTTTDLESFCSSDYFQAESSVFCLTKKSSIHASGAVMPNALKKILHAGNIRERCHYIFLLLCRDRRSFILNWLLQQNKKALPSYINTTFVVDFNSRMHDYVEKLKKENDWNGLVQENKVIATAKSEYFRCMQMNQKIRYINHAKRKKKFCGISPDQLIPPLSDYEKNFLLSKGWDESQNLPWKTGKMRWKIHKDAMSDEHKQISGLSGHSESLIIFLQIFKNYDLIKLVLVCVVWLVPCHHHTIWEILATARMYGLDYDDSDPVQFCDKLLREL